MVRCTWTFVIGVALAGLVTVVVSRPADAAPAEGKKQIVFVHGKASHGYGGHAYGAAFRMLARILNENVPAVHAVVIQDDQDLAPLETADAIVLGSDGGRLVKTLGDRLEPLMKKGVGLACIHYAVAPLGPHEARLLAWIGGIYKQGYSRNPIHTAAVKPASPAHPICRGWKPFTVKDELYYRIWFGEGPRRATPMMTALLPPNKPKKETVAWAIERADGGRGFGFTGAHYHANWRIDPFRTMVLNAILWVAKVEVPAGGVRSTVPKKPSGAPTR